MSNNFQPTGLTTGGLINSGGTSLIPASGSDDSKLLVQQENYAASCLAFIATVTATKNGRDITNEAQKFYLAMMNNYPMSLTTAKSYFANVSSVYWASGVIDYKAAYAALTTTSFPA